MLASNPALKLEQISSRAGIPKQFRAKEKDSNALNEAQNG